MSHATDKNSEYSFFGYLLVSLVLAAPVLLWPLLLSRDISQIAYVQVFENWMVSIVALLLVSVTADSVLTGVESLVDLLATVLWIVGAGMLASYALRSENGGYLLAMGMAIHSFRSVPAIWHGSQEQWWRWPAWLRDAGVATYIFGCLLFGIV